MMALMVLLPLCLLQAMIMRFELVLSRRSCQGSGTIPKECANATRSRCMTVSDTNALKSSIKGTIQGRKYFRLGFGIRVQSAHYQGAVLHECRREVEGDRGLLINELHEPRDKLQVGPLLPDRA